MRRQPAYSLVVCAVLLIGFSSTILAAPPDDDGDGVANNEDNCPQVTNADQADLDSDGFGDACDVCPAHWNPGQEDLDADGLGDLCDLCPDDYDPQQADTDSDGAGDACDADDDEDGVEDELDNCPLVSNPDQSDIDSDGSGDLCDVDADGDGSINVHDNCPYIYNYGQMDQDNDDLGDVCDPCPLDADNDSDTDGHCGDVDNCPAVSNPAQGDSDSDGLGDACDPCPDNPALDADSDGLCGSDDNCPTIANPGQDDGDSDSVGDLCDNCIAISNSDQRDTDFDGQGDDCDSDDDDDGIDDHSDNCPVHSNSGQEDADSDGDGDPCDPCPSGTGSGIDSDSDGYCDSDDSCPTLSNPMQGTVRLHGQLYHDHDVDAFKISPDSGWVVFSSDLNVDDRVELSSSEALDGASRILNPALQADGDVEDNFDITPDSGQVLFVADVVDDGTFDIYKSSIDSGGTSILLSDRPLYKDPWREYRYIHLRPDGQTVHFIAEDIPGSEGPWWWWSIPVAGGPSTQIGGILPASPGEFSDDSLHFLFVRDGYLPRLVIVDTTTLLASDLWNSDWLIPQGFEIVEEASRVVYWGVEHSILPISPLISVLPSGEEEAYLELCAGYPDVGSAPAAGAVRVVFFARTSGDTYPCEVGVGWFSDRIDGGDRRFLTDDATGSAGRLRIAPDGQSALYITDGTLRRIDILGGTPETIYSPVTSFKFSPDGSWIVFLSDGSLHKVPLNGIETTLIGTGSEEYLISPNSGTILYRTADMRELWAVGMNGGVPLRLSSDLVEGGTLGMGTFSPDSSYVVYWAHQNDAARMELFRVAVELDSDGDTWPTACDQAPEDPASWSPASEVRDLILSRSGSVANLSWSAPESPGGTAVSYAILRSEDPASFRTGSSQTIECLPDGDPTNLVGQDGEVPATAFYYLIRADHGLKGDVGPDRERGETWSCP